MGNADTTVASSPTRLQLLTFRTREPLSWMMQTPWPMCRSYLFLSAILCLPMSVICCRRRLYVPCQCVCVCVCVCVLSWLPDRTDSDPLWSLMRQEPRVDYQPSPPDTAVLPHPARQYSRYPTLVSPCDEPPPGGLSAVDE